MAETQAAAALIRPLDLELPCATGVAIKRKKTSLGTELHFRNKPPGKYLPILSSEATFFGGVKAQIEETSAILRYQENKGNDSKT